MSYNPMKVFTTGREVQSYSAFDFIISACRRYSFAIGCGGKTHILFCRIENEEKARSSSSSSESRKTAKEKQETKRRKRTFRR